MRIAVVGLGLIGGSIALAAERSTGAEVSAWDADPRALGEASSRGVIGRAAASLEDAVDGAEAAFAAVPVGALADVVARILAAAPPGCVVTDVGSTKRAIVAAQDDQRFVGGHPLAGAESAGVAHARADLFDGATWYLTPTPRSSGVLYERLYRLLGAFGALPEAIDADAHDATLALVSHLPHVLANALVAEASEALASDGGTRLPATGPSFRDATRVAGAPSTIWTDIYLSNRDALIAQLDAFGERLRSARALLADGDAAAITAWNEAAAGDRRRLLHGQLGGELAELRVAVPNRPGVVAELALELGRAGVNIADLALHPAPDMSEGVIALWLPGDAADRAQALIERLGHPVFRP